MPGLLQFKAGVGGFALSVMFSLPSGAIELAELFLVSILAGG